MGKSSQVQLAGCISGPLYFTGSGSRSSRHCSSDQNLPAGEARICIAAMQQGQHISGSSTASGGFTYVHPAQQCCPFHVWLVSPCHHLAQAGRHTGCPSKASTAAAAGRGSYGRGSQLSSRAAAAALQALGPGADPQVCRCVGSSWWEISHANCLIMWFIAFWETPPASQLRSQ